jgi:hypothetical protein
MTISDERRALSPRRVRDEELRVVRQHLDEGGAVLASTAHGLCVVVGGWNLHDTAAAPHTSH